jgi:hypothetical protein
VPIDAVIELSAFDMTRALERRPNFLEPEYPFEWTGVYDLPAGLHFITLDEGPDPSMKLVVALHAETSETWLRDEAERCVRRFAHPPAQIQPGEEVPVGEVVELMLDGAGIKRFALRLQSPARVALTAQHTAEEFDLTIIDGEGVDLTEATLERLRPFAMTPASRATLERVRGAISEPVETRTWVAQHEHDDEVGSFAIDVEGKVHPVLLNAWLDALLRERGTDLFRMKGFLNVAGEERRVVFQGVHMLLRTQADRPWGDLPRRNQLVFIGRNLDREVMREGFLACLT